MPPNRSLRVFVRNEADRIAFQALEAQAEVRVGFDYPATLRGNTAHFNVYYDPSLGNAGAAHADAVLAACEGDYGSVQTYFGGLTPPGLPFNIIIAPGIPGAYHWGCGGVDLYCDDSNDTNFIKMLVVAEEVEVFENAQGLGWDCGATNGEGVSRVMAETLYSTESLVIASTWLNNGRPDYVTANEPGQSDGDTISNACAVLFLHFLASQLGFSWSQIIQAGAASLGQTYTQLTQRTDAFPRFKALLDAHFPESMPSNLQTNDPFPLRLTGSLREFLVAHGADLSKGVRTFMQLYQPGISNLRYLC